MKKIYLLLFLSINLTYAQKYVPLDFSKFDVTGLETDLFIKNSGLFSTLNSNSKEVGMYGFIQCYKDLANNDNRFNKLKTLQDLAVAVNYSNYIKIGLLHLEYETLSKNAIKTGKIVIKDNYVLRKNSTNVFTKTEQTIIAPLAHISRGLNKTFILDQYYFINNTNAPITTIRADFNDGKGLQPINFDIPIHVNYKTPGKKELQFEILLDNGEIIYRKSPLHIQNSNSEIIAQSNTDINEITSSITPNLSTYSGITSFAGLAEYQIFLGADNELNKPIFIVDGFDPDDTRNIASVYNLLNYEDNGITKNLADRIRDEENFDVIIINLPQYLRLSDSSLLSMANASDTNTDGVINTVDYPGSSHIDGGADFIERNAFTLVEIINTINSQKVTDSDPNVVIGPSMGGLITRYALNYMEANQLNHDTRLWMSLDSPHLGANVPIGFQHLFNYLAYGLDTWVGDFSMEALRPIVDGMLKSPAARQMLVDHYEQHLISGEIAEFDHNIVEPTSHSYATVFYNKIESLTSTGFPETTRNVSMINGSGNGNPYYHKDGSAVTPGDKVLDAFIPGVATLTDAYFDTWLTPTANQQIKINDIWIDAPWICFCDIHAEPESKAFSHSDGIDAASGGLFDLAGLAAEFGGSDPTFDAFFNSLTIDGFNFIPSVSSLAINDHSDINWFQNIALGEGDEPWDGIPPSTNPSTPFVNWFMPEENELHVKITIDNVDFAWHEIVEPPVMFSPKVYLQGAMLNPNMGEENLMRDDLRVSGIIPVTSPYEDGATCEPNVFNVTGPNAIVDWIWIEIRSDLDNTTIIHSQSAFLQRNGTIVDIDGISPIKINIKTEKEYYIAINHRNHLGIITDHFITLTKNNTIINFTDSANSITHGTNAQTTFGMPQGFYGMWSGNVRGDNNIRYQGSNNDTNVIKDLILANSGNTTNSNLYSFTGYQAADINLDGTIKYQGSGNDSNIIKDIILSHPDNQATPSNLFIVSEQLPEN